MPDKETANRERKNRGDGNSFARETFLAWIRVLIITTRAGVPGLILRGGECEKGVSRLPRDDETIMHAVAVKCTPGRLSLGFCGGGFVRPHLATLSIQVLLMLAEGADLAQKLVRLDEEPGAQQKGEEVSSIGIIFLGGHHMLHQGFQRARHQIPVPIYQRLEMKHWSG